MGFSRFGLLIALRLVLLFATLGLAGYLLVEQGFPVATALTLSVAVLLAVDIFRFVRRTNLEVARFLDAVRYADFGQRFEFPGVGAGFSELGTAFTQILNRFRADRQNREAELRHLKAILEHVPVPLITLRPDGEVHLWNNAARRLFGSNRVRHIDDLAQFGELLPARLQALHPGERALISFQLDAVEQTLAVVSSEITLGSRKENLISLLNIQNELDGMQIDAWQDLVRVLTHEIMNSITPVSSLAHTAADLVADVSARIVNDDENAELKTELGDVKDAVNTLARRSDGLMEFVTSYRQLTRLPDPDRSPIVLAELFAEVGRLASTDWPELGLELAASVQPESLSVSADRQMIAQVLINLLQNAAQASTSGQTVELRGRLGARGFPLIEVLDRGHGISDDVAAKVFVPFYTTRKQGSGVGLAFSRQVMIAHGGTITFAKRDGGGTCFTLSF